MENRTLIIGASGKKQSGKNTMCDGLEEWIKVKYGENCKTYSFADALKEKVCMEVMGLTREQCYGSDEDKNTLTSYTWERLPYEVREENHLGYEQLSTWSWMHKILPKGQMTAREVMQVVGTDIFRKYFDDSIWVNATFRSIQKESYPFALISDVRFPSEVEGIVKENGFVIRLLRDVCEADSHSSEKALDDYDWESVKKNAFLVDNSEMSIEEQNRAVCKIINEEINNRRTLNESGISASLKI